MLRITKCTFSHVPATFSHLATMPVTSLPGWPHSDKRLADPDPSSSCNNTRARTTETIRRQTTFHKKLYQSVLTSQARFSMWSFRLNTSAILSSSSLPNRPLHSIKSNKKVRMLHCRYAAFYSETILLHQKSTILFICFQHFGCDIKISVCIQVEF